LRSRPVRSIPAAEILTHADAAITLFSAIHAKFDA